MTGEILRCLARVTATGLVAALILAVDPGAAFANDPLIPSKEQKQTDQDRCKSLANVNASILSLTPLAWRKTLVVLLEGLGGRLTSPGIVSLQNELAVIPKTIVPAPIAQHDWRYAANLFNNKSQELKSFSLGIA